MRLLIQFSEPPVRAAAHSVHIHGRGGPSSGSDLGCRRGGTGTPLAFSTTAVKKSAGALLTKCPLVDFFELHMERVESIWETKGIGWPRGCTVWETCSATTRGMAAVEYAIEHDDGRSMRALDKADVILVAPSRCGKDTDNDVPGSDSTGSSSPTTRLVDEDFESAELPRRCAAYADRCFGMTTTPARLSQVRQRREAQLPLCLTGAMHLRAAPGRVDVSQSSPSVINSSAKSVEEMSTVILQA
jgi:regulator of PEP synthase PpsR (kinase-PPPase family)